MIRVYIRDIQPTGLSNWLPLTPPRPSTYFEIDPELWLIYNIFYLISWEPAE